MIQDVLSDDNISFEKGDFTWQEAIQEVSKPLLKKEIITENYVRTMIEDVEKYGPYIVIGPHLALAHDRPEDGAKRLGLSLAIFVQNNAATVVMEPKLALWSAGSALISTLNPSIKKAIAIRIPPPTTKGSICETPFISCV